jgi:hypothetical protein
MDRETSERCPSCGWPLAQAYELVSWHDTSEGPVVYSRCPCGRLRMHGTGWAPVVSSRAAEPGAVVRAVPRPRRLLGPLGAVIGAALIVAVAATLPVGALLACLGLAAVVGGLAYAWAWLTADSSWPVRLRFTVRATLLGAGAAVGLTGFAVLFGPASVPVITALYAVLAVSFWLGRAPGRRAC